MEREELINFLGNMDYLSLCDIIDTLRMEGSTILKGDEEGCAVLNPSNALFAVSFSDDFSWIDPYLTYRLLVSHGDDLSLYLKGKGYSCHEKCYLYSYAGKRFNLDYSAIKPLTLDSLDIVASLYYDEREYAEDRIRSGKLWGLFADGELAGFSGYHSEGAMGMLEILPEYRRRGFGRILECFLIDKALDEGRIAYCNVYLSNEASVSLQSSLGLKRGEMLTSWMDCS